MSGESKNSYAMPPEKTRVMAGEYMTEISWKMRSPNVPRLQPYCEKKTGMCASKVSSIVSSDPGREAAQSRHMTLARENRNAADSTFFPRSSWKT